MSRLTPLDITYYGKVDIDRVGQQDAEDKACRKLERKQLQAFQRFLAGSDIFRLCGGNLTLLTYLLQVLPGEVRQEHVDRAQALRQRDSIRYPLLPATDRIEYLRIELRNPPSVALLAMIERDGFLLISKPDTKLQVFYGQGCLAAYKARIAWPDIVAPCDIAPETVETATAAAVEGAGRLAGGDLRAADAPGPHHEAPVQRVRLDRIHDQPEMKAEYQAIIARRGRATPAEIGECLAGKYGLARVKQGTIDKIAATLTQMAADGILSDDAGHFALKPGDGEDAGAQAEGRAGGTSPPGATPGEGGEPSPDAAVASDPPGGAGEGVGKPPSGAMAAGSGRDAGAGDGRGVLRAPRPSGRTDPDSVDGATGRGSGQGWTAPSGRSAPVAAAEVGSEGTQRVEQGGVLSEEVGDA